MGDGKVVEGGTQLSENFQNGHASGSEIPAVPVPHPSTKRYTTSVIVEALRMHAGLVFLAAKSLGCMPKTIYRRARQSHLIREAIRQPRGELVDMAESKLRSAVLAGDARATSFVLCTLGRKRGFAKAREVRHSDIPS
jgi:hypothetical protein